MEKRFRRPPKIADALRARGNPYWSLQLTDDSDPEFNGLHNSNTHVSALFLSENPYASDYYEIVKQEHSPQIPHPRNTVNAGSLGSVSKAHFRARCRQIFMHYIPEIEKGRLRKHHQEFISRNEVRNPHERAQILACLKKYDLSDLASGRTYFNREEGLTEEKLKRIEQSIVTVSKDTGPSNAGRR